VWFLRKALTIARRSLAVAAVDDRARPVSQVLRWRVRRETNARRLFQRGNQYYSARRLPKAVDFPANAAGGNWLKGAFRAGPPQL